jgi:hypothetical protein
MPAAQPANSKASFAMPLTRCLKPDAEIDVVFVPGVRGRGEVDNGPCASMGIARIGVVVRAERCLLGLHRVGRVGPRARLHGRNGRAATPAERLSRKKHRCAIGAAASDARLHGDDRGEGGRLYVGYDELVEQALLCLARARAAETSRLADELTRTAIHLLKNGGRGGDPEGRRRGYSAFAKPVRAVAERSWLSISRVN